MVRRRESAIHSTFIRRILWIMVRMTVLASGSRGNSSIVSSATTRILVDAGLSCRELMKRMKAAGEEPTALDAILITHEHKDHVQGMAVTARKLGIPVYLTEPTHRAWIRWMTPQKRITYAEWLAQRRAAASGQQSASSGQQSAASGQQSASSGRAAESGQRTADSVREEQGTGLRAPSTENNAEQGAGCRVQGTENGGPRSAVGVQEEQGSGLRAPGTENNGCAIGSVRCSADVTGEPDEDEKAAAEEVIAEALREPEKDPTALPAVEYFRSGSAFRIGDIAVTPFTIPHDAADPVGFVFEADGVRIAIATDLGYMPSNVHVHLRRCDVLMLESNHDVDMLRDGPYPWSVKQRVMSRVGHLSNYATAEFLAKSYDGGAVYVVLAHLSENNNLPELARISAERALRDRMSLLANHLLLAEQDRPLEPIVL
jgi:phosphoribosyl 1,2-cyclic phosphodiesterase